MRLSVPWYFIWADFGDLLLLEFQTCIEEPILCTFVHNKL